MLFWEDSQGSYQIMGSLRRGGGLKLQVFWQGGIFQVLMRGGSRSTALNQKHIRSLFLDTSLLLSRSTADTFAIFGIFFFHCINIIEMHLLNCEAFLLALNTGDIEISKQQYECVAKIRHFGSKHTMKVTWNARNGISESSDFHSSVAT